MNTARIRLSEEQLQATLEALKGFAIILIDLNGIISSWNDGAKTMLGYEESEALGQSASIIFTEADRKARKAEEEMLTAMEKGSALDERWHVRKDGSIFWGSGLMTCFYDGSRKPKHFVKIFRDMSDQKRLVDNLQRSNRDLEQFAHTISHDLQEPLNMVASYAELLKSRYQKKLGNDADQFIEYLIDGALRAKKMVASLLEYSKLEAPEGAYEQINFESLVKEVLKNLRFAIEKKQARLSFSSLPVLAADSRQMLHLFQNLISNAIKYSKADHPLVQIRADEAKEEWIFSVTDNGIGIDPRYYSKIFNLFSRLHNDQEYEGTGVGLAICKKIVENHQGRIWVESTPGKGSTFYFSLPKN